MASEDISIRPAATPAASYEPETKGYLSGLTFKRTAAILLAAGVALRATGVWDNSYLKTAALSAAIGAAVGGCVTAKDEKERNLHALSEVAFLLGFMCGGASLAYSFAVEGAFQSLAAVGNFIANQ